MGIVFGMIQFVDVSSGYALFKEHCLQQKIEITGDYPEDKFISTKVIPVLCVVSSTGQEIKGWGTSIAGMDTVAFEIAVYGIDAEFYKKEFEKVYKAHKDGAL